MRKSFLIARSNLRKSKGQAVAIIVLVLIASLMLNLWLMLSMDYTANFKRYHNELNAEHVTVYVGGNGEELRNHLGQTLDNESRVSQYILDDCLNAVGDFSYNGGEMECDLVFLPKDIALTRTIGRAEVVEEGTLSSGIYLPMIYKSDEFQIGKTFELTIGNNTAQYTICGFFNSVMLGSHNCSITEMILTSDKYAELSDSNYAAKSTLCSVRLHDKDDNEAFESDFKNIISKKYPNIYMGSNCYDIVEQSRYISQMICSGIMSAMAFLVLLIALVVIASNIGNYIQVNMKNLGALKAIGYTSRQLIGSLLVQFLGITLLTSIIGVGLSYCLFPMVNSMMIAQTGIPYNIHFLPLPVLISILILGCAVAFAVWISARKIKKIEPIVALRSGVETHSFKRNYFPLEKTKAPLTVALAFKSMFSSLKQNITLCVTMIVLSLIVVFSGVVTANFIIDSKPFVNLIIGETADSSIDIIAEAEDDFLNKMKEDSRVEKAYLYNTLYVAHNGGSELMVTLCDDFSKINNPDVVIEGRFSKYENEIVLAAKYAKEHDFEIGDEIEISSNGKTATYLICGFTQISNYLGRDCLMTREGYERLGTLSNVCYYINLEDGVEIEAFNEEVQAQLEGSVINTVNLKSIIDGGSKVYISLMTIIVIAVLVLSAIIIAFVLYLLVRTMLNNKKQSYGIYKSLGFTTKQLILQTALSFMPAIIISTIIGLIISSFIINPLIAVFLIGIGIVKCTFEVPVWFNIIVGIGLVLFAFAFACLLSLKVRKISPRTVLAGE